MKRLAAIFMAGFAVAAHAGIDGNAVIGGALGGATGALVGSAVGGRDGAIIGGAIGGAAGTAVATSRGPAVRGTSHDQGRHLGHRKHRRHD